jgi:DNA-binding XRE family transcriptional regulator
MAIKARDYIAKLPVHEQAAIKAEARKVMLEELSLSAIREARRHSQIELANKLGVQQPAVSKIERQTDLYLSTLSNYITAVGGRLEIVAQFPDRDPIRITQFKPLKRGRSAGHTKDRGVPAKGPKKGGK